MIQGKGQKMLNTKAIMNHKAGRIKADGIM